MLPSIACAILGRRIVLAFAASLWFCGVAAAANPTINVDLSKTEAPIRHVASGLLWAFYQGDPPLSVMPTLYDPLNLQFLRCSTSTNVYPDYLARDPQATIIAGFSDPIGYPTNGQDPNKPLPPPPWYTNAPSDWWTKNLTQNWSGFESKVKTQISGVKSAIASSGQSNVVPIYDVWNEPNENGFFLDWLVDTSGNPLYDGKQGWPQAGKDKYFELYRRTYNLVRANHPGALITGPSVGQSEPGAMQGVRDFKDYCVANNCIPDYWNWHFGIDDFGGDLPEALGWNLNRGVLVPEYLGPDQSSRPGRAAWEIAVYESSLVSGCCKAIWSIRGQSRGTLNWLIFEDPSGNWKKHGIWWTYATYASMTGDRMTCTTTNDSLTRVRGLVAYDKKKRAVVGLLGNSRYDATTYIPGINDKSNGYQGNVDVNIQSVLPLGRTVRLVVEKLPSGITGFSSSDGVTPIATEVAAPVVISDTTVSTLTNKISFRINWADGYDAYRFTITAP